MSISMHEEGFEVVLGNSFTVEEIVHNGRGKKNTIIEHTHYETASVIPDQQEDEYMLNRIFIKSIKPTNKWRESMNSDDFGPQRYDKEGNPLDMSSDNGLWIDSFGNELIDESYCPLRDDFGVDIPSGKVDLFDEVKCSKDEFVKDTVKRFNLEWYLDDKGKLDIWKLKQAKLEDRKLARWIWDNKDLIEYEFRDIDKEWNENVPNMYMEDVNEDKEDNDIGISDEEKTHQTPEQLRFWKSMIWHIGHNHKSAYGNAKEALKKGTISLDEYGYILSLCHHGKQDKRMFNLTSNWTYILNGKYKHIRYNPIYQKGTKYNDLISDTYLEPNYKPTTKKEGITHINYKYEDIHRVLHFYCPNEKLKEGFLIQIDWNKDKGFFDKKQWRLIGDKARVFYTQQIKQALKEHRKVRTVDIVKESKSPVIFKNCWNLWLDNTEKYFATMKQKLA